MFFCPDFKTLVKARSPAFAICLIKCICHSPIPPQGAVKGPARAQLLGTHHQQGKAARGYRTGRALQAPAGSAPALGAYDYNFIFPVTKGACLSHSKDVNTEIQTVSMKGFHNSRNGAKRRSQLSAEVNLSPMRPSRFFFFFWNGNLNRETNTQKAVVTTYVQSRT